MLWVCDVETCTQPAVRTQGECSLCNRHLCFHHVGAEFHQCPRWEVCATHHLSFSETLRGKQDAEAFDPAAREAEQREIDALLGKIDVGALTTRASKMREGIPCSVPALRYDSKKRSSVMGGMNYHLDIQFEDGIVWLARIRRINATSPPPALRDFIFLSEVATLKFLEQTSVQAPQLFDFALEGPDNPVGIGFLLIEKLPGSSLRWSLTTPEQKTKVMEQLADIFAELERHPFRSMGSLDQPGSTQVGAFAQESLTDFEGLRMLTTGPCSSLEEYHHASIQRILELIVRKELYADRSADAYLIHRFLLDMIPRVLPELNQDHRFYLKHADDKGDHILVDEKYNVTGIIDWEWAYTAPNALAFNSPIMLLPVSDFYKGLNELGPEEGEFIDILERKGHLSLAEIVRKGRLQHRFAFCCGYDLADWTGFLGLFQGLRDAIDVDGGLPWSEWKAIATERYSADPALRRLLSTSGPTTFNDECVKVYH